ncbi:MAG TPA: cytochrome c oxidase subunit II [Usitatibacter sp.]|jgi:cytochrome c oxidase subunit 2|nr:cytochrome c oxidase subunit II [Usitatibacter sp.]
MHLKHLRAPGVLAAAASILPAFANYHVDILEPVTPISKDIYNLHWGILWVCVAIFVVVFGAMFWSILRHRKSRGAKAAQFHENTTIEVIWTIVPFVILIAMALPATNTVLAMKDASNSDMSVKITGYQWKWEYDYQQDGVKFLANLATPRAQIDDYHGDSAPKNEHYLLEVDNPMVVPVGKKVRLLITSNDVIHGWYVPQLGVNQYGIPGFVKEAWFTVDKPGIYRGQCSQICGKEHAFMPIVVDARSEADYAAWVKEMKAKTPPALPEAVPQQAPGSAAAAPEQVAAAAPAAGAPAAGASAKPADGKSTFDSVCTVCHTAGVAGAPKFGNKADWAPRIAQGKAALYNSALHGKGAMPPKGGNAALSDETVKAAVDYMAAAAK